MIVEALKTLMDRREEVDEEDESEGKGLLCMFCGARGFDTQEELEDHIESHPHVKKR